MTCHLKFPQITCPKRNSHLNFRHSHNDRNHSIVELPGQGHMLRQRPSSALPAGNRNHSSKDPSISATAHPDQLSRDTQQDFQAKSQRRSSEDSLVKSMLSDPDLEGEPLKLLRTMEAFWKVSYNIAALKCIYTQVLSAKPLFPLG